MISDEDLVSEKVSSWVWENFHRRGAFSHYRRCRIIARCAHDSDEGWVKVWMNISILQTMSLVSSSRFYEIAKEAREQIDYAGNVEEADREELIPCGCVSPLGTTAAINALYEVTEAAGVGSFFGKVTIPFLLLTAKELSVSIMVLVMLFVPGVVAFYRMPEDPSAEQIIQAATVLLLGQVVSYLFVRVFRKMI